MHKCACSHLLLYWVFSSIVFNKLSSLEEAHSISRVKLISDTACPWCQLTYSISCYQLFMSTLFAFFSSAHLNKGFPLSSLSNALIQEIRRRLKIHLSSWVHFRSNFRSVLKKVWPYTKGCKYVFVSVRDEQFLIALIYCTPGRGWQEAGSSFPSVQQLCA